jgi:hypothetical protein
MEGWKVVGDCNVPAGTFSFRAPCTPLDVEQQLQADQRIIYTLSGHNARGKCHVFTNLRHLHITTCFPALISALI